MTLPGSRPSAPFHSCDDPRFFDDLQQLAVFYMSVCCFISSITWYIMTLHARTCCLSQQTACWLEGAGGCTSPNWAFPRGQVLMMLACWQALWDWDLDCPDGRWRSSTSVWWMGYILATNSIIEFQPHFPVVMQNEQSFGCLNNLRHSRHRTADSGHAAAWFQLHVLPPKILGLRGTNRSNNLVGAMALDLGNAWIAFFMVVLAGLATCLGASAVFFHNCVTRRQLQLDGFGGRFFRNHGCTVVQILGDSDILSQICISVFFLLLLGIPAFLPRHAAGICFVSWQSQSSTTFLQTFSWLATVSVLSIRPVGLHHSSLYTLLFLQRLFPC